MNISSISPINFNGKIKLNMGRGEPQIFDASDVTYIAPVRTDCNPYQGIILEINDSRKKYVSRSGDYFELWKCINMAKFQPDDNITEIDGTFS